MQLILNYIEKEEARYLNELIEFLSIPSISSAGEHKPDVERAAHWLADHIKSCGIEDVKVYPTEGHPIVYAQWLGAGPEVPTVLIYGHYDVQPVDPLDLWNSPPFSPVVQNGKIWGRGTADDKGQLFAHIKSIESFMKIQQNLPVNVKILIEGEEEAMVSHLDDFIIANEKMLTCDVVIISDTEWFSNDLPTICYGLRGISFAEVTVTGPNRDVHSGSFGGAIDNPLNVLCWMIASLKDPYGRITIPGFYDDVLELTEEEKQAFKELPYNEKEYCDSLGINNVNGEIGYTTLERSWARPTLDLNGIFGGYTGEGSKTIIPSKATAKISTRLVPNQNPEDIAKKLEKHLHKIAPPTVKVEVKAGAGGYPVLVPIDSKEIKTAVSSFKQAFGKEPVFMREGGSIPIVETFQRVLKAPSVLMGLGLPGDNIHSPNENFDLKNFYGGIKASAIFLEEIGKKTGKI
jgi:acetylornithine deacetylase/succinyl-diaminopimelate desuccinylase-like protein